jgi:hypothetical protein
VKKAWNICRLLLTLLAVAVLGFPTPMTAYAAGPGDPVTTVKIADEWFWCGEIGTSPILVSIANDPSEPHPVHGVEVHLSFDPTKLQVVDADGDPDNGVQIAAEGALFPSDEQAVVQAVDNEAGTILFAVSWKNGEGVQDATDAAIATITWESGFDCPITTEPWEICSEVSVADTLMSDADGYPITVDETVPGKVCDPVAGLDAGIAGTIKLQGRYNHSGVMVSALLGDPGCCSAFTDAGGYFKTIPSEAGTYNVTAWKQGYLRARRTGVQYNPGQPADVGIVTLLGGDVVPDEVIDICDVTYIASRFGRTDPFADITDDGQVNILDLTVTAANFGRTGPLPWSMTP